MPCKCTRRPSASQTGAFARYSRDAYFYYHPFAFLYLLSFFFSLLPPRAQAKRIYGPAAATCLLEITSARISCPRSIQFQASFSSAAVFVCKRRGTSCYVGRILWFTRVCILLFVSSRHFGSMLTRSQASGKPSATDPLILFYAIV